MTLEQIQRSTQMFLTPEDVAPVLGSHPQTVRESARQNPELIKFPFAFLGNRMKIPRLPFLAFLGVNGG